MNNEAIITVEELCVQLNREFKGANFTSSKINRMRKQGNIPALDVRTPGAKHPRWMYQFSEVLNAINKNGGEACKT